jgi:L-lactate dehydrogenase complex protein LldG
MRARPSPAAARILARIRAANRGRAAPDHPGDFGSWRPGTAEPATPLDGFVAMFEAAGGEVARAAGAEEAAAWLRGFASGFSSVTVGAGVGAELVPELPRHAPRRAALALSAARCAIAETGSLVLDARDGRRTQLLAPVHVVVLDADTVHGTVREAFLSIRSDLPSAVGLHSGPSKSADIGQVMVKGVHGPGRLVTLVVGADTDRRR